MGYNLNIAGIVGLLALLGIASETSIVMLLYLEQSFQSMILDSKGRNFIESSADSKGDFMEYSSMKSTMESSFMESKGATSSIPCGDTTSSPPPLRRGVGGWVIASIRKAIHKKDSIKSSVDSKDSIESNKTYLKALQEAVIFGAAKRVRPKLMTVFSIIASLIPIMFSQGVGSEIMKAIATPMLFGMISSTILTLFIIPLSFFILKGKRF
ncbi:hypothetical protein DCO58_11270 [Helicobacter saguini]|uniref:Efflux RND transporter permease subunit n=1 Tax=Helicobacter saguini TaxID=1548018 RepID=A0A347W0W1_9HELI|nr:hypothetical protein [Helicobacter saguini]MWV68203.1 hypothetical protein [Helicobacter saguini]MWV70333.1 hypothetical protein [Helicobacter saguini]MWV72235.1 hypothetical protein [Helicobacter saguini]TLD95359.1 efflux RND transporter permease subunit [Helicobacter saguini]